MSNILKRQSIRKYKNTKIEPEKVERILRAAMNAPSGHNLQPWEFIVVDDAQMLSDISKMSPYTRMIAKAPLAIIYLSNIERVAKEDLWWTQDLSASVENSLLQIVDEGLGGVWCGFYPHPRSEELAQYFNLPAHIKAFAVVAVGYPDQERPYIDTFDANRIHYNTY